MVTSWERANHLTLLCVMFYCGFVSFPCGVLGQVLYLIVSIPDLCLRCLFTYFNFNGTFGLKTRFNTINVYSKYVCISHFR